MDTLSLFDEPSKATGFIPTTHDHCIYRGIFDPLGSLSAPSSAPSRSKIDPTMYEKICDLIGTRLNGPIKRLGLLELHNGTSIEQTRDYIRLHSTSYIDKILAANT
jgi:hypothetical protein